MKTISTLVMILSLAAAMLYGCAAGQPPPMPAQEQPEVLTRGPVNEAFAEPVNLQMQAGLVVSDQPPAEIEEIPPAERPRGDRYVWVPGYWAWDGDRDDYIWISGCWRAAPPNMYWVPGYWSRVSDGWEWVAGCWMPADVQNIQYLPPPPAYDYEEPPGPPPSGDDIWVPSCPYWYQDRYIWRPGYWLSEQPNWVWVPSHYIWTPRGYIFCDGYWDYPLEDRGVLFAPVYFRAGVYDRSGFSYSPTIVIDLDVFTGYLFTYPRYCHYYFGDYYDDAYLGIGIFPRYEVEEVHTWYDPVYVYDRWQHRDEPRWEENERNDYRLRREDRDLRPPRTYQEMETRQANLPEQQKKSIQIAEPLTRFETSRETSLKFERMNAKTQQNTARQATAARTFGAKRNRWEAVPEGQKPVQTPTEQKGPVTRPQEPQRTAPPPAERRGQVTQPSQTKVPYVPPREVRVTRPEQVKVPAPPIVGRRGSGQNSPPPRPTNERGYQGGQKGGSNKKGR